MGLLQSIHFCPVQMCQFHQFQIVRRLLTNNPHLPAGVELLTLIRRMFSLRKDEFITAFMKWCEKWKEFLAERTLLASGKTTYTHRRLRTARRSIKTHLTWLYTCRSIQIYRYLIQQTGWKDLTHNLKEHYIIIMD